MKNLSVMIKPASSLCNMRCQYCFYKEVSDMREVSSYGIMQEQTVKMMLDHIIKELDSNDQITFAFQGGEPTLAGLEYYKNFVGLVDQWDKKVKVNYALQTNGILIDDEWCTFLKQYNFLIGISYDLLADIHDEVRQDANKIGTSQRVLQTIQLLKKYQIEFNVLCTLTSKIAENPQQVWKNILVLDLRYVQFTPCLDDISSQSKSKYALTPELFASFYTRMFTMWLKHYKNGKYRSIKLFDDLFNLVAYGIPTSCGINGTCQPQLVVEADGSVYPCDFYCLDHYRLGSFCDKSIKELYEKSAIVAREARKSLPQICGTCNFRKLCGGGCKRMHENICVNEDKDFCGYQKFLKVCIQDIIDIVQQENGKRYR